MPCPLPTVIRIDPAKPKDAAMDDSNARSGDTDQFDNQPPPLNVFEFEDEGRTRTCVAMISEELADRHGIPEICILGDYVPDEQGEFVPDSFERNDNFVIAYVEMMNRRLAEIPEIHEHAKDQPNSHLYLLDPRVPVDAFDPDDEDGPEPDASNVVGCYTVDSEGVISSDSFEYNAHHLLFHPEHGPSGIINEELYQWLLESAGIGSDPDLE